MVTADNVKSLRLRAKLTQEEFSLLTGVPVSTLSTWERGTRVPPSYIVKLLYYFLFTAGYFDSAADQQFAAGKGAGTHCRQAWRFFRRKNTTGPCGVYIVYAVPCKGTISAAADVVPFALGRACGAKKTRIMY